MIDYIKTQIINYDSSILLKNPLLDFSTIVSKKTGELGKYYQAYYHGLRFKIYEESITHPTTKIYLDGSLHKYWNKGQHNFNDFNLESIISVLYDLYDGFEILPHNLSIKQLEIGINFHPPIQTEKILRLCLFHRKKMFKWIYTKDEGNYIQAQHSNYIVKVYDKQKHYTTKGFNIPNETMRFELKFRKQKLNRILNRKGIITLQDILSYELKNFKQILLIEWNRILFYDSVALGSKPSYLKYSNPNFWLSLKTENFKYHRKRLNGQIETAPRSLKQTIEKKIAKKFSYLYSKPTQIKGLYIDQNLVE